MYLNSSSSITRPSPCVCFFDTGPEGSELEGTQKNKPKPLGTGGVYSKPLMLEEEPIQERKLIRNTCLLCFVFCLLAS